MATRRTGLWLLTTFFFFLLLFTVFVWGLNRVLVGQASGVGRGTVLVIRLQGTIGEIAQRGPFAGAVTVREIDEALHRAATDSRVAAVFLEVGPIAGGYGKAQEIRASLQRFKESGKPVLALLELGSNLDLYIAAAADTIYQVPSGQLILGMLVEVMTLFWSVGNDLRAFLVIGVLGSFTTFSAFSLDTITLFNRGDILLASLYVLASVGLALAAFLGGMATVRLAF